MCHVKQEINIITMKRNQAKEDNSKPNKKGKMPQEEIVKNRNSRKSHKCNMCTHEAKTKVLLQYHVLDFHKTDECAKFYTCSDCKYITLKKLNYSAHMRGHRPTLVYCANCPFTAKLKSSLIHHVARHSLKAKHKCYYCSYSSNYQTAINNHQWIHPEYKRNTIYQCIHCTYLTRIKSHFERHQIVHKKRDINGNIPLFRCEHCLFKCSHKSSFDRHNAAHERKEGAQCNQCSYTARNSTGLTLHKKYHYQENSLKHVPYLNKKHKCTTCSYQTDKSSHFTRHLATHDDSIQRKHKKCALCNVKCVSKLFLEKHFLSHIRSSDLRCSKYSFSSNRLALLHTHMIEAHKEKFQPAKLFSCPNCPYTTIKKCDLNRHVSRHLKSSEINWLLCNDCPFRSKRKYVLSDHCKSHKMNDGIKCCYCSFRSATYAVSWHHVKLHL